MAGAAERAIGRLAVVLFNLGGPDGAAAVEPFLFNLFGDKAIIGLPNPLRWLLAKFIAHRRAPIARRIYEHLGGGSPLLANTEAQARALQTALHGDAGAVRVFIAMRYWHPFSSETARTVKEFAPDRVVLLPLYPQFSTTTTASSVAAWHEAATSIGLQAPSKLVCCYPTETGFVEALAQRTAAALTEAARRAPGAGIRLIFTAHGLPEKIAKGGDPYVEHVLATCHGVAARIGVGTEGWELAFQSRIGPVKWAGPYTDELIAEAATLKQAIVLVPIAFVSEHSETLVELDIEYRKVALERGAPAYIRVATVSTHPRFIGGLADIVRTALESRDGTVAFGSCSAEATACPCAGRAP